MPAQTLPSPVFRFGGFGDSTVRHPIGSHDNDFDFGEVDVYVTAQFSDTWSALAEGLVQRVGPRNDADARRNGVEAELERLYLAYSRSDSLRVEVGRVYTGIIDWNERDHRGRFLQTSIDVPAIARRQEQGGAWPLHFLGGWVSGSLPGPAGLRYGAGVGEGRSTTVDDVAVFARGNSSPAGLVSLDFSPSRLTGFRFGAAALADTIPAPEGRYREIDRTLSASYVDEGVELRSEWSRMDHQLERDGSKHVTEGWYALMSVRLRGRLKAFRPYVLLDHVTVAKDEPYLASVRDRHSWAAGARWDALKHLVLKLDYRAESGSVPRPRDSVRAQIAVSF